MSSSLEKIKLITKRKFQASLIIFFFYFSAGALFPIFNLLFQEKNFNLGLISLLLSTPNLFILIAGPLWAFIADLFNIQKRIIALAMFLTVPFIIILNYTKSFPSTMIAFSLFAFNFSPLLTMTDNTVLNILENNQNQFGKIRVWGSISYGMSAWIVGLLAKSFGINIAYWISTISLLITFFISWKLPSTQTKRSTHFRKDLLCLLKDRNWSLFLVGVFLSGYSQSIINGYFAAFLKNIGVNSSNIGFAFIISAISEIPIMLLSPLILRKLSFRSLFSISLFALFLRNLLLITSKNYQMIMFTQIFHGLTSSLFWICSIIYVRSIVKDGLLTSSLAILGAIYYGFAGLVGSFFGGQIFYRFGPNLMFSTGLISACIGLITLTYTIKNSKRSYLNT